ncbi:MAG TPA: hypothetical protein VM008_11630 [Phycisphaerae bacterium]|nr:hypothetical protein [Phycisphaerae bacterium]
MPALEIACELPKGTYVPKGEYIRLGQNPLVIENPAPSADEGQSTASMAIEAPDDLDGERKVTFKVDSAQRLLCRVNFLLRWHRSVTQWATVREMTLAQASPFVFLLAGTEEIWGGFDASPFPVSSFTDSTKDTARRLKEGFSSGIEPPVEELLLLDARQALFEGRFREAVLFCWSTIDSTFSRRFDVLVDQRLGDEWAESRRFVKGLDFGLRHKMAVGLRMLTGRSLYREPNEFWGDLSTSYDRRNAIIHRGETADENDARLAVRVAEKIVEIMHQLVPVI